MGPQICLAFIPCDLTEQQQGRCTVASIKEKHGKDSEQVVRKWQECLLAMVLNVLTVLTILITNKKQTRKMQLRPQNLKLMPNWANVK